MRENTFVLYLDILIITLTIMFLMGGFFAAFYEIPSWHALNVALAVAGSLPTLFAALRALVRLTVTGNALSAVALAAALSSNFDIRSVQYIILMLSFARLAGYFARTRATRTVEAFSDRMPGSACVEKGDAQTQILLGEVSVGDIVVVKSGEKIPVDGIVERGDGLVNEFSLSGESQEIFKRPQDKVYASTTNEGGLLYVKAEKIGKDTVFSHVIDLIRDAPTHKAPTQKTAEMLASWFLLISFFAAGAVLYFTGDVVTSIALLLIISVDAIAVASPIAIVAGIAQAATGGAIIKGAVQLEDAAHITAAVLNKIGERAYGGREISFVRTFWGTTEDALLSFAATAGKNSEHPLARTIVEYARKRDIPYAAPDSFGMVDGGGVKAEHKGKTILLGDERFISGNNIHVQSEVSRHIQEEFSRGATPVIVAYDMKILGVISVTDALRVFAKEAVRKLGGLGIGKIVMVTRDNKKVAEQAAAFLGIDAWYAEMSPEDKFKKVKELSDAGEKVIIISDGVADAATLSVASAEVALGSQGADIAIKAVDISLMHDKIERIPEIIDLSRRVIGVIRGNIGLWIGFNVVGITLVFAGVIEPAGAALFHFLTGLIPLGNSLRLFRKDK